MPVDLRVSCDSPEGPAPVDTLTSSSDAEPCVPAQGVKRKNLQGGKKLPRRFKLDDVVGIQLCLAKKCAAGCTRRCKEQFQSKQAFSELSAFRKSWQEYHKVDQDQIDARYCLANVFLIWLLDVLDLVFGLCCAIIIIVVGFALILVVL